MNLAVGLAYPLGQTFLGRARVREALRENIEQKVRGVTSLLRGSDEKGNPVKEVLAAGQTAVEELRAKVDQGVKQALDFGGVAVAQELEKLQRKIETLEKKLEQLGK